MEAYQHYEDAPEDPWGSPRVPIRVNIPSVRMCAKGIAGAACKPGAACMEQAMRIARAWMRQVCRRGHSPTTSKQ
ncbi:hypothetical protein ABBQ38_008614 [Trebouxia sp. C0009 RCD-2024]